MHLHITRHSLCSVRNKGLEEPGLRPGWGNTLNKVSSNDFPHVMDMMCCVFDH